MIVIFALTAIGCASIWHEYVSFRIEDADPLLALCWVGLVGLAAWRVEVRRDVPLALAAFAGGALIESWGTRSGLWTYFSHEQPPLFILPAWPFAALATERVASVLRRRTPLASPKITWIVLALAWLVFLGVLLPWVRRGMSHPLTWIAMGCVAITMASGRDPRRDLLGFIAGSVVGIPLEYWGTTRACWVYWDSGTPPLAAVLSHGFATVAFARGATFLTTLPWPKAVVECSRGAQTGSNHEEA